ncbi:MAG: YmdB family metallophosphoesterase [Oscillospiraceae bacterium]|nr:YmdB family metallophosphoesterase [Oscillospiraceae bacterium]
MIIKVMAVGDVCGRVGLDFLRRNLRRIQRQYAIDFTVVNGENANVVGVTPQQCEEIFDAGADVITLGNHTWTRTEIQDYLDHASACLRPANFAPQCPGRGVGVYDTRFGPICVVSLIGRFGLDANTDNPFVVADNIMADVDAKVILVDFHAEATSEKLAMGYFLDGRASAVWGTHTHVQTSDCEVFPDGTGYITDLGMTGPVRSVISITPDQSIGKFLGDPPRRYSPAGGAGKMECAIFDIDTDTGKCLKAESMRIL